MRGNNREMIIARKWQKEWFSELLLKAKGVDLTAYCLMDNHIHLIVRAEIADLSEAIKKINIKYAMGYNRSGDRVGHVFQDRYRSEVILDDPHLLQAIRYVHNNPVKAGLVSYPEEYLWSSYREYIDATAHIVRQETIDTVLDLFAGMDSFRAFHHIDDSVEFFDTPEDLEQNRALAAQRLIESFCLTRGISEAKEVYRNAERLEELVTELLQKTGLSHRKIAGLLEISSSFVHRVGARNSAET